MKTKNILFGLWFVVLLLASCKSREEKALETIRDDMNKNLDDITSYEPIETKIDSLKYDRYGDTLVMNVFFRMKLNDGVMTSFQDQYKKAKKIFDIWDDPLMYEYSSFAYEKRKKAYKEMQVALIGMDVIEELQKSYLDTLLLLDKNHTGELYGWRVRHKYRYNKKGTPSLVSCIFFMDMDCENIFFRMNEDDTLWWNYKNYIDQAYKKAEEKN